MNKLQPLPAMVHVVDSHRWFAAAVRSWRDLKKGGFTQGERDKVGRLMPNVEVAVQASALVYGRVLIEFYAYDWSGLSKGKLNRMCSDIGAKAHFCADYSTDDKHLKYLVCRKDAIDKHLAHLSEFRYPGHPKRDQYDRVDWCEEIDVLACHIEGMLKTTSIQPQVQCRAYFVCLAKAVHQRMNDRAFHWPPALIHDPQTGALPALPAL